MARTVAEKLQIKPGDDVRVDGADAGLRALLESLPEKAAMTDDVERPGADVVVAFTADRAALDALLARVLPHLIGVRASWIVYPKGNVADINRDSIWRRVEEVGWTLTANIAVDATWSAVRMKPQAG